MLVDQFGNTVIKFSETEQKTGEIWINGKPIYRKTVTTNFNANESDKTVSLSSIGIINHDKIWIDNAHSFVSYGNESGFQPVTYGAGANDWKVAFINPNGLRMRKSDTNTQATFVITLNYTKTTD